MSPIGIPRPKPVVLIVEDEPIQLIHAVDVAEDAGLEAITAQSADKAIEILESRLDASILMTDVNMAGTMDGLRLAALVRDRWPPIPIIIISGLARQKEITLQDRVAFFQKPYDDVRLAGKLREFAGMR